MKDEDGMIEGSRSNERREGFRERLRVLSLLAILAVFVGRTATLCQQVRDGVRTLTIEQGCIYERSASSKSLLVRPPSAEVVEAVNRITSYSGLPSSFELLEADIENASAVLVGNRRIILYDEDLLARLRSSTGSYWSTMGILAHEVAHHLIGHTLSSSENRNKVELESDYFSGFVLYKLGGTLAQAQSPVRALAPESGGFGYPSRRQRLQSVQDGWTAAAKQLGKAALPPPPEDIQDALKESNGWIPIINLEDEYAGCEKGKDFQIVTLYKVQRVSREHELYLCTLEFKSGKREDYYLEGMSCNEVTISWLPTILEPGRKLKVRLAWCGVGGTIQVIYYLEPLRATTVK